MLYQLVLTMTITFLVFTDYVKAFMTVGLKVSILLNHAGSAANGKMTNIQPVSASDIPSRVGGDIPRALTTDEIYIIVDKFAEAAKRAVTAGFDAVEIQADMVTY